MKWSFLILSLLVSFTALAGEPNAEFNSAPTNAVHVGTMQEVNHFLQTFTPPPWKYQLHVQDCRQFARQLIESAHSQGLAAHLVVLTYSEGVGHAIVALPTTKEILYADDTPAAEGARSMGVRLVLLDHPQMEWINISSLQTMKRGYSIVAGNVAYSKRKVTNIHHFLDLQYTPCKTNY